MGYYTNYKMTVIDKNGTEIDSSVEPLFDETVLYQGEVSIQDVITQNLDACKWYDHQKDMLEYSANNPEYLFILDGQGEETGDIWRKFYKNGKSYEWKLEYTLPDFDAEKLK